MSQIVVLLLAAVVAVTAEELVAVVHLVPHDAESKNVTGDIKLVQSTPTSPVHITGKIFGLSEGLHGFHIHEKGDLSAGCLSAGGHFNPDNVTHGGPDDDVRHVGDLGNVVAKADGVATVDIVDSVISLTGPNSVVGRALIIHSDEDDLGKGNHTLSLTTGNSGDRWACGIIGIQSPTGRLPNSGSFTSLNVVALTVPLLVVLLNFKH